MSARLLSSLMHQWEALDGYAVAHGMPDLRTLSIERLCNFVYWMLTKNGEPAQVDKFRARIWMPPKGVVPDARSPWSAENETAAFKALASGLGMNTNSGSGSNP